MQTGRIALAEKFYDQALAIHRQVGNRRFQGAVLGYLANLYVDTARAPLAEQAFKEALAAVREAGDRYWEGALLCASAKCLLEMGRAGEAAATWRQGHAILRELDDADELTRVTAAMRKACAKAGVPPFEADPLPPSGEREREDGSSA
jgi:tetratricopeptide (TPR) repeat protein